MSVRDNRYPYHIRTTVPSLKAMAFIKLGSRYVNLDLITDVFVQDRRSDRPDLDLYVDVYLAAPMGERSVSDRPLDVQTRHVRVKREDAERLLRYLDEHLVEEPG